MQENEVPQDVRDRISAHMDNCVTFAKEVYRNPEFDGVLILSCETKNKMDNATWAIPLPRAEERADTYGFMSVLLNGRQADLYSTMTLAWMSMDITTKSPSQAADRMEVMCVSTVVRGYPAATCMFYVERDQDELICGFRPAEHGATFSTGSLLSLFNLSGPVSAESHDACEQMFADTLFSGTPKFQGKDAHVGSKLH